MILVLLRSNISPDNYWKKSDINMLLNTNTNLPNNTLVFVILKPRFLVGSLAGLPLYVCLGNGFKDIMTEEGDQSQQNDMNTMKNEKTDVSKKIRDLSGQNFRRYKPTSVSAGTL